MKLYADRPARRARQALEDAAVAGWVALWVWAGVHAQRAVERLAAPGREAEQAGAALQRSLSDAARDVGDLPLAGGALRAPFDAGAASGRSLAAAARSYQDAVTDLATAAGLLVAVLPVLAVVATWLPRRVTWVVAASAAARLRDQGPDGPDLLALRALARSPLPLLARAAQEHGDLVAGWRRGEPAVVDRLARLQLDELGLRR
jgi:hypothetical protein